MRSRLPLYLSIVVVAASLLTSYDHPSANQSATPQSSREEAYRANNIGVAHLEQFNYKEAATQFRQALKLEPSLALARVNLGIALHNLPDPDGALRELKAAADVLPASPQAHYVLGLIARSQNRTADGIAAFQRTLQIDPGDPGANINLGQLYMQQRKYPEAIAAFRAALANEPYNVTATYNLAMALTRSGERQEGQAMMQKFQVLRTKGYATTIGQNYLEQGRYAEAIASTGAEPGLVDTAKPDVVFTDATSTLLTKATEADPRPVNRSPIGQSYKAGEINEQVRRQIVGTLAGGEAPLDFDGDGDMDLFDVSGRGLTLYRNDGGKLADVTGQSGIPRSATNVITAVGGDYDNDGRPDIVLLSYGGLKLYHNDGNGKFSDRTAGADVPAYPHLALSAALVDVDHDGDLDIFIAGFVDLMKPVSGDPNRVLVFPNDFPGAPNLLVRNNGDGKFTDITAAAMVAGTGGHAIAVAPTDYDNRRDIDLLVANYGAAPTLFSNQRDGTFRDVAGEVGLNIKGGVTSVAAGDLNKDDFTDFFFGKADGPGVFAISDGKSRFVTSSAPGGSEKPVAAQFLDYDNDGLLDLVLVQNQGARVLRNLGTKWDDVTERAVSTDLLKTPASSASPAHGFASADIDGDGDTDLIVFLASGDLKIARNDGGNRNKSLKVQLTGRASNRSAVGTKIEARAGSLKQKLETYAATPAPAPADVIFGLGKRDVADAVRLLWPAGIVQAETDFSGAKSGVLKVTEIDRKPSSCPYLYTWNGERFEFVTDFLGGGEMGYWLAPGLRNHPDPDEYVRIRDDQLKEKDGRYELRATNELEEALYVDRLQLIAIDHPSDTEVYPNEGMTHQPRPFRIFATRGARPPRSAIDDHGHDVTARIANLDRQYPDDFNVHKIRGYADKHTLTLDLGEPSQGRTLLLLTGWTDYAFSSDNVAASQGGLSLSPPELQVKDSQGRWRTVIADIGIPVGRPQTIVLDLSGKFPTRNREARIVTNMRIYWDQILVDTSSVDVRTPLVRLNPIMADLHWRGFSAEVSPDGRQPFSYDYSRVSLASPWKTMPGRYTREGDVRELLMASDDMFVISRPGDEISVSFDATKLRPLANGWRRTFLLYADGFSKEMDINSASPDQVVPLPFHTMKSYPYSERESYPMTRRHRAYLARYNTRVVRSELPSIDAIIAGESRESGASSKQR